LTPAWASRVLLAWTLGGRQRQSMNSSLHGPRAWIWARQRCNQVSFAMKWQQAIGFLRHASGRRGDAPGQGFANGRWRPDTVPYESNGSGRSAASRAHSICVASGKGGTGKSVLAASLSQLLARQGKLLLVDADLGVGNAHLLQGVAPRHTLMDLVEGRVRPRRVLEHCAGQVDLLAGASGIAHMAELSAQELEHLARGLEELEGEYRYVVVDSAAGVSSQTLAFAVASDLVAIVTTPDLTAMTDAYAFLKAFRSQRPDGEVVLVVNRARDGSEARDVADRIRGVAGRFLGAAPPLAGWLPEDPAVRRCVDQRAPAVRLEPAAPWSRAVHALALSLLEGLESGHPHGLGESLAHTVEPALGA